MFESRTVEQVLIRPGKHDFQRPSLTKPSISATRNQRRKPNIFTKTFHRDRTFAGLGMQEKRISARLIKMALDCHSRDAWTDFGIKTKTKKCLVSKMVFIEVIRQIKNSTNDELSLHVHPLHSNAGDSTETERNVRKITTPHRRHCSSVTIG